MSQVRQLDLLEAGCQPWNGEIIATSDRRFAYCATLAIYIYQYDENARKFHLHSIMSEHKKTITSIAWHPSNRDILASSSVDTHVVVWSVPERRALVQLTVAPLPAAVQPRSVAWVPQSASQGKVIFNHTLSFLNGRGPLYIWRFDKEAADTFSTSASNDTSIRRVSSAGATMSGAGNHAAAASSPGSVLLHRESQSLANEVTRYRWNDARPGQIVFGHGDGTISLYSPGSKPVRRVVLTEHEDDIEESGDPVTGLEWDPLGGRGGGSTHLLVASAHAGVRLVDADTLSVLVHFRLPSGAAEVQTLAWISEAPGMFVTGDSDIGMLRIFTVAKESPVETIRIKQTGFRALRLFQEPLPGLGEQDTTGLGADGDSIKRTSSLDSVSGTKYALPPGHVVCTFMDGGVGLYDLAKRKWIFIKDMGHIETIFDCRFKSSEPNFLATASFDGTIKVWDVRNMKPRVSSPGNEGIIYCLSWAPGEASLIAAATSKNGVFVFDVDKGVVARRYQEHSGPVFSVAWNPRDMNLIASASGDGSCVVRKFDGTLVQCYKHPSPVFGVDWSMHAKDLIATGCDDKLIRIFYTATNSDKPLKVFSGHTAKVFRVQWSPLKEGLLCSGSDDGTIRIWNYSSGSCQSVLQGHSAPVRGLLWHWEVPFLLLSGSWDTSIRVWDVRDGACVDTVLDHGADVYGLTAHPARPFLLASSSRDSTVRLWSISRVTAGLELRLLSGGSVSDVLAPPGGERGLEVGAPPRMAGCKSLEISKEATSKREVAGMTKRLSCLMQASPHAENVWHLVQVHLGVDDAMLPASYSKGILHMKHLIKYRGAEAREREMCRLSKFGAGVLAPSREEQTREAARWHIRSGNLQHFCELQTKLGRWEKALALAPGVSMDYWKQLTKRYTAVLMQEESEDTMEECIAVGDVRGLTRFLTRQGKLDEAVVIAQAALEGHIRSPPRQKKASSKQTVETKEQAAGLLRETCVALADSFFYDGSPVQAACCHFAMDDIEGGLGKLVRGHELELALWLGKEMNRSDEVLNLAREWLARRTEKYPPRDAGLALLNRHPQRDLLSAQFCARFSGNAAEIDSLHTQAGFASLSECQVKAESLLRSDPENMLETVKFFMLSNLPEKGLEIGLQTVKKILSRSGWCISDVWALLQLMSACRSSKLAQQSCTDLRANLLLATGYCATLVAITRGYSVIVSPLFRYVKFLLDRDQSLINLPITASTVDKEFYTWKLRLQSGESSLSGDHLFTWSSMQSKASGDAFPLEPGSDATAGSHLPSHTDTQISHFTGERIKGPVFFLEDAQTAISLNEALMWAKVNPFSPLGSGQRINPF